MIRIDPEAARRIEAQFATKKIGKRELKNVKGEVMIYQVLGENRSEE
jgi:hypothetical protein